MRGRCGAGRCGPKVPPCEPDDPGRRRPAPGALAQLTGQQGGTVTTDTVGRRLPLQQLPEFIFGHADNRQDVPQRSPRHISTSMDRHRNGSTIRMLHDVMAATDPSHGEAGLFQGLDDSGAGQDRHLAHDRSLVLRSTPRRWTDSVAQVGLARNLAKHMSFKADAATICLAKYRDQAVIYRTQPGPTASSDFKRELLRRTNLGDQCHQRFTQISYGILRRTAVTDRTCARPDQRGRTPHPILILFEGIRHMHDSAHPVSLDQPARTPPLTSHDPVPSAATGSRDARLPARRAVRDSGFRAGQKDCGDN